MNNKKMSECTVCTEKFNNSSRNKIICENEKCKFLSCSDCVKKYLLDKSYQEPHCMSCKNVWDLSLLTSKVSKFFLKGKYRKMKEKVLFEEEKTFFPELQETVEKRIKIEKLINWNKYYDEQIEINKEFLDQTVRQQIENHKILNDKKQKILKIFKIVNDKKINTEKKKFLMKCIIENCRGFLCEKYKCGICNIIVCKDCHKEIDDEHKCDPDDIKTVIEILKNTKPCPKCQTRISKIDGCDQMFCTQCHTPFSWKTGLIETGVVHNPHYFEELRKGQIKDIRHRQYQGGCGQMITYNVLINRISNEKNTLVRDLFYFYYQKFVHFRHVVLPEFIRVEEENEDRIQYLMGKIDEEKFKQKIYVKHNSLNRKREEQQIIETFISVGEELFISLNHQNILNTLTQIRNLIEITCSHILKLDEKYEHVGLYGLKNMMNRNQWNLNIKIEI
jgi:hypothetical protein